MRVLLVIVCVCCSFCAWAGRERPGNAKPGAVNVSVDESRKLGKLVIPNGTAPVEKSLTFPAIEKKRDEVPVLRFQARLHSPKPDGWNYYLELSLNGKRLSALTADSTPRILNRKREARMFLKNKVSPWPYWGSVGGGDTSLLTFFGSGGRAPDKRVRSDRREGYWYVLDISDVVNYRIIGQDDHILSDKPNELILTNNLLHSFVKNKKFDLIVEDLAVGYIPMTIWRKKAESSLAKVAALKESIRLQGSGFDVAIGRGGGMHVLKEGETYAFDGAFSYPGSSIGHNALSPRPGKRQHVAWKPVVRKEGPGKALITARCPFYRLERRIGIDGDRIRVKETLTNIGPRPVAILIEHTVTTTTPFKSCLLAGAPQLRVHTIAENPTVFIAAEGGSLGVVAEDNVLRRQLNAAAQPNRAVFKADNFALDVGGSHTFEWTIYPLAKGSDYWAFINRVRRDWNVNFTIYGPWDFFPVQRYARYVKNPSSLKVYVERRNLKRVALDGPWLGFSNINIRTGKRTTRAEYKAIMQEAAAAFRKVDPDIQLMASVESFPVMLSVEEGSKLISRLTAEQKKSNYPRIGKELLDGIQFDRRMEKCLIENKEGKYIIQLSRQGGWKKPVTFVDLIAYPRVDNAHHQKLMEQARFAIEEVGLDGVYVDCFSYSYGFSWFERTYDKWDGISVEIDPRTGRITRKYTDTGLAGARAKEELIRYVLRKGKVMVANSYAACRETQSLPAFRFAEIEFDFNPLAIGKGEKPPCLIKLTRSHLGSPIGLGVREGYIRRKYPDKQHVKKNYSRLITKAVITYLRHGALYYHYCSDYHYYPPPVSEGVPHVADFGPVNHMFPITPVELHEGWIVGEERIITALSGTYTWKHPEKPKVFVFDSVGRPTEAETKMRRAGDGWSVTINLEDWENVAVIE